MLDACSAVEDLARLCTRSASLSLQIPVAMYDVLLQLGPLHASRVWPTYLQWLPYKILFFDFFRSEAEAGLG